MTSSRSVWWLLAVTVMGSVSVSATVVSTAGHLVSPDSDLETSAWLRELFGVSPDAAERRCFDQQKVLHRASQQCFQLLQRGPCGRREWLVFDRREAETRRLEAVCRRRQCAPAWGFDPRSNKCFRQHTCPPPTSFHYTLFGDGRCLCNATTAAFATRGCQQLFKDDVCPQGQILAPRYSLLEGMDATCTPDPCVQPSSSSSSSSSLKMTTTTSPSSTMPPPLSYRQSQTSMPVRFPGDGIHFGGNRRAPVKDVFGAFPRPIFGEMHFPSSLVLQMQRRRSREETSPLKELRLQRVAAAAPQLFSRSSKEDPKSAPPPPLPRDSQEEADTAAAAAAANQRLNILLPQQSPPSTNPKPPPPPDTTTTMETITTTTSPQPSRLKVKYQDGTSTCHAGVELSTTCALQMKPLFSDLSEVKVPLCVDTWFRFAIGRVGKSEECVTNDDGVCAAKVIVASSEPFDWDFE